MTHACTVVTQAMSTAILQVSPASHEGTVMTTPATIAVTRASFNVTLSITVTVVGTVLFTAVVTRVVGGTEACAVVATTTVLLLIAPVSTFLERTIRMRETFVAVASLCPLVTDTVATAIVGAEINLGTTLKTNETSGAQAVTLVTLATVLGAVFITSLVTASLSLPTNLAQASGFITTVTILTVRADGLRTIHTTITNITLAATSHTIATTMSRAPVGAHLLLASLTHETRRTITGTVNTATVC